MRTTLVLAAVLVAVIVGGWLIDDVVFGDDVGRNVTVDDVDVSGLDREAAAVAVEADGTTAALLERPVTLVWEDATVTRTAAEFGVTADLDDTLDRAADRGSLPLQPLRWLGSLVVGRDLSSSVALDPSALEPLFTTGEGAVFVLDETVPELDVVDGELVETGRGTVAVPDTIALAELILASLAADAGDAAPIEVPTTDGTVDLPPTGLAAEFNTITADGMTVRLAGTTSDHDIPAATIRGWAVVTGPPDAPRLVLDPDRVQSTLESLFTGLGEEGEEAGFFVDYVGNVHIVGGAPGSTCCEPAADLLFEALEAGGGTVVVRPVEDPDARGLAWAESLGITELVGEFTTRYTPGQSRVTNIERIAELTRGAVIEPGTTFSVNDYVGRRTTENGFVAAGVISNGVFSESVGGGISQYATTLFNAAFFAGLDFGEYQSHSIYISRYPYGREATVSFPHPDLQIVNSTPHGVLLWPTTTADAITVQLYSTHTVAGEQTGQTERREGVACTRVTTTRTRTWVDGRTENDTVTARYRPEGIACDGSSTVPTTTTVPPPTTAPPPPTPPPATEPPPTAPPTTEPPTTAPPTSTTTADGGG